MARNGERRKTNVEESKGGEWEEEKRFFRPLSLTPPLCHFFLAHFSLRFPNYPGACYMSTTFIPSFPTFYGIYSTWASNPFGSLLFISRNEFGSTNDSETVFFFLSFFSFGSSLTVSIVFIRTYFSLLSSVSLTLPPRLLQIRGNDLLFCSRPFVRSIIRAFLACKKYGLLCGLKDFALIDVLVSWKL